MTLRCRISNLLDHHMSRDLPVVQHRSWVAPCQISIQIVAASGTLSSQGSHPHLLLFLLVAFRNKNQVSLEQLSLPANLDACCLNLIHNHLMTECFFSCQTPLTAGWNEHLLKQQNVSACSQCQRKCAQKQLPHWCLGVDSLFVVEVFDFLFLVSFTAACWRVHMCLHCLLQSQSLGI